MNFFDTHNAEFTIAVQLCTNTDEVPIENPQKQWPEDASPHRVIRRLRLPRQTAFDPEKEGYFEDVSYEPAHSLTGHKPLGGINHARLAIYNELAKVRLSENGEAEKHPTTAGSAPD